MQYTSRLVKDHKPTVVTAVRYGPHSCSLVCGSVRCLPPYLPAVHVAWPSPVGQAVIGTCFVTTFGRHIEIATNAQKLFAAATIGRVCVEDPARLVLVENAVTGEVFNSGSPCGCLLEVVESAAGSNLLWPKRDVEIKIEIAVIRRNPPKTPPMRLRTAWISSIGARATTT